MDAWMQGNGCRGMHSSEWMGDVDGWRVYGFWDDESVEGHLDCAYKKHVRVIPFVMESAPLRHGERMTYGISES